MSGNVWEWCFDGYDNDPRANDAAYTSVGFVVDPQGGASGGLRVLRGGSWSSGANYCVVGIRRDDDPVSSLDDLGFRGLSPLSHILPVEPQRRCVSRPLRRNRTDKMCCEVQYSFENKSKRHRVAALAARKF
ncbi:SUMF1/EgtB/PvdO family nonheme iron enzyme [Treponema sp. OMZ 857]|nr:SUMF1/EgtB/PvdO family nonheme iron enzyme [Treponema sp. OMZ 857]